MQTWSTVEEIRNVAGDCEKMQKLGQASKVDPKVLEYLKRTLSMRIAYYVTGWGNITFGSAEENRCRLIFPLTLYVPLSEP